MWPFNKKTVPAVPEAIIIGAQRCGTTSLFEYLSGHPQILPASRKEVHYFDNNYQKGPEWYGNFFSEATADKVRVEASPYYIFHPHVPGRIGKDLPNIKLIIILRDPVTRAYSHFRLMKKLDREPLSFAEALKLEEQRLGPELNKMLADPSYRSPAHQDWSYMARGHYDKQIAVWKDHFKDEQVLILRTEEMAKDPVSTLRKLTRHLGISDFEHTSFPVHNHVLGDKMDDTARAILEAEFKDSPWRSSDLNDN